MQGSRTRGGLGRSLITTFGLGLMRPASGTWGSLPPVVLMAALWPVGHADGWLARGMLVGIILVFSGACVVWGDWAEAWFGRKDPGEVVADETAGMALTLLFVMPHHLEGFWRASGSLVGAFVLFRLMDVIKPPPARGIQRLPAGWGILMDDLVAGIYAGLVFLLGCWLLGW